MQAFINFIVENKVLILSVLLGISEILGSFEMFKSSSVFELVVNWLKKLKDMVAPKPIQ